MTQDHALELENLYEQHRLRLRGSASRVVGWDDAEDVVQEAFVKALAFPGAFRQDAAMTTWMTRIVVNTAIDHTRRQKRRPQTVSTPHLADVAPGVMPRYAQRLELKSALAATGRGDRELLVLAGLLGWTYKETAHQLGLTVGATKSRLCTARCRLRRAMTGQAD